MAYAILGEQGAKLHKSLSRRISQRKTLYTKGLACNRPVRTGLNFALRTRTIIVESHSKSVSRGLDRVDWPSCGQLGAIDRLECDQCGALLVDIFQSDDSKAAPTQVIREEIVASLSREVQREPCLPVTL